jgi:RNA polymerase sigma factor (sigma-70 family)
MSTYSETDLITGIRSHETAALNYIYNTYFPVIEGFVIQHEGDRDQARDVFQEAMIIVYRRVREGRLELTCKFGTYLYAICKNIWLQERKKYQLHAEKLRHHPQVVNEPAPDDDPLMQQHFNELFEKHFNELSKDCQKILSLFFNNHTVEEIRDKLRYKDLHHAADRKYRCKKSLIKRIINDPLFKKLKNEAR